MYLPLMDGEQVFAPPKRFSFENLHKFLSLALRRRVKPIGIGKCECPICTARYFLTYMRIIGLRGATVN